MSKETYSTPLPIEIKDDKDIKKEILETEEETERRLRAQNKYEVEAIVAHRPRGAKVRCTHYLVKWVGYPETSATWENATRISHEVPFITNCYWTNKRESINGRQLFEVDYISSHKPASATDHSQARKYLVHFVGFARPDWVRNKHTANCQERVTNYWQRRRKRTRELRKIKSEHRGSAGDAETTSSSDVDSTINVASSSDSFREFKEKRGAAGSSTSIPVRVKQEAPSPAINRIAAKSRRLAPRRSPSKLTKT